jgi:hypothetical protein
MLVLTVVVGAGAVGLAVPGGAGLLPGAPVHGGVAGVVGLGAGRVGAADVELGLAAVHAGEEAQEQERRRGGEGGGGAHGRLRSPSRLPLGWLQAVRAGTVSEASASKWWVVVAVEPCGPIYKPDGHRHANWKGEK